MTTCPAMAPRLPLRAARRPAITVANGWLPMPLLKAKLMGTKSIFIAAVALGFPVSVFAEVLASGSVYFDSPQSYADVKRLAAQGDNRGIAELIAARHVSQAVPHDLEVSVPAAGPAPYGLVEFRFPGEPTPPLGPAERPQSKLPGSFANRTGPRAQPASGAEPGERSERRAPGRASRQAAGPPPRLAPGEPASTPARRWLRPRPGALRCSAPA
jgi:hypothetical protein